MADELDSAKPGDSLSGDQLQESIDTVRQIANDLESLKASPSASVLDLQSIGKAQAQLRSAAASLVGLQVELIVGKAKITADHINAAVKFANDAVKQVANVKKRIKQATAIVAFIATVASGDGATILAAAVALKGALN